MSSHSVNDSWAKPALFAGAALLILTVLILLKFLFNTIGKNSTEGDIDSSKIVDNHVQLVGKYLTPIGTVKTGDAAAVAANSGGPRSGEEVYKAVCFSCHGTGAAGAPMLDDAPNWKTRVATGFDALLNSAINGKGAMPARAGQNVIDEELKAAIIYMTTEAGFDMGVTLDAPKAEAAEEAPAAAEESTETETPAEVEEEPAVEPEVAVEAEVAKPEPFVFKLDVTSGAALRLEGVNFETGSANLTAESAGTLDQVATQLSGADVIVEIAGHTDNTGEEEANKTLSQARADSVKAFLESKGIPADRMSAVGYGQEQPTAENSTEAGRLENRRVELRIK